ncbi:beta-lactamase-like protein [Dimargaris cristalligena]|uniref:Beta-lactamase-like protein n=1 Tax=Dimargaris cristalligena TaxID=215637 RepID=A0A4P9ZMV0_9FUNG|nr:beta-lactamase-like protein [Dimargaris cristalligena]|eukprot:RKP34573.1 beta-lactamase-like protein [Dimargaris cristalligena]
MFELAVIHYGFASDLEPGNRELRIFAQKAHFLRQDREQGLAIYQLLSGRDIAHTRSLNPIQNKIFDFAKKMRNFVYLIVDRESKQCAVVDACWDVPGIMRVIKKEQLTLVAAIVTHYHFDHVGGIPPAPFDALHIRVSGLDTVLRKFPHDGFRMTLGARTSLQFLHTPGHSEGSQCILVNDGRLFTGDTLFPTSCGRVDLPGGCKKDMLHSLQNVLKHLDPSIMIYPGHDYGGAWSTIETEQQSGLLRDGYTAEWDEFNNLQLP